MFSRRRLIVAGIIIMLVGFLSAGLGGYIEGVRSKSVAEQTGHESFDANSPWFFVPSVVCMLGILLTLVATFLRAREIHPGQEDRAGPKK
jgi:hypothetical protein